LISSFDGNRFLAIADREHRNGPLAFDVKLTEQLAIKDGRKLLPNLLCGRDSSGCAHANHARSNIDSVAPNIELVALLPHDAGHHGPGMDADPHLPAELRIDQGRGHLEPATDRGADRIIDFVQQPGSGHEAVSNSLNLLEPVLCRDTFENDEQRIEPGHHVLRLELIALDWQLAHA